mmetsp:Transcript_25619/g.82975  ORF Transcript_25619/g.82975 Transcript_25619/m.82975 type:complete len:228 (-) Transcript_25619:986-1669(-)
MTSSAPRSSTPRRRRSSSRMPRPSTTDSPPRYRPPLRSSTRLFLDVKALSAAAASLFVGVREGEARGNLGFLEVHDGADDVEEGGRVDVDCDAELLHLFEARGRLRFGVVQRVAQPVAAPSLHAHQDALGFGPRRQELTNPTGRALRQRQRRRQRPSSRLPGSSSGLRGEPQLPPRRLGPDATKRPRSRDHHLLLSWCQQTTQMLPASSSRSIDRVGRERESSSDTR